MAVTTHIKAVGRIPTQKAWVPQGMKKVVHSLIRQPGEWFEIRRYTGTPRQRQAGYIYAHNCRRARIKSLSPAAGFDVQAESDREGAVVVYARFVGLEGEHGS